MQSWLMRILVLFMNTAAGRKVKNGIVTIVLPAVWRIILGHTTNVIHNIKIRHHTEYDLGLDLDDSLSTMVPTINLHTPRRVLFKQKKLNFTRKYRVLSNMETIGTLAVHTPIIRRRTQKKK